MKNLLLQTFTKTKADDKASGQLIRTKQSGIVQTAFCMMNGLQKMLTRINHQGLRSNNVFM